MNVKTLNNSKNDVNYISILNVIAAISVVILHTNGAFWQFSTEKYWFKANVIECLFYFAVPIFFMISGATLIDYRERYTTKVFFKKRFYKTFIPFVCWSIFALIYNSLVHNNVPFDLFNFKEMYNAIIDSTFFNIYWFFPALFSVYLCIPVFSAIDKKKRKEIFIYILLFGFILNNLLPFLNSIFKLGLSLPVSMTLSSGYLIYLLLGYMLHNITFSKMFEYFIYFFGIIGLLLHMYGTYKLSINASTIVYTFKGYTNLPCILYSVSVFLFVKNNFSKIKNVYILKFIYNFKDYTFPLYLIHLYVLDILTIKFNLCTLSLLYVFGMPLVVIPICLFVIYILRKIPLIRAIVP